MAELDMSRYVGRSRPLLVFAPRPDDPRSVKQRHAFQGPLPEAGLADRQIVVIETFADGDRPEAGAAFGVGVGDFAVVLFGKDGGEKHRWSEPVSAQEIFGKVDAMPMRQREVADKHALPG